MTPDAIVGLLQGSAGAIAALVIGFVLFARAIQNGTLVPGRYYQRLEAENEYLRDLVDKFTAVADRTVSTAETVARQAGRASGRREP